MISDVKVIISTKKVPGKRAFGMPLLLASMETAAVLYTVCANIDEVKKVFPETTPTYKAAATLFMQDNAPSKIAVCGSTEKATTALEKEWDKDWRQLILVSNEKEGDDTFDVISTYIEAKKDKMFFAHISDVIAITTAIKKNERTVAFCHKGGADTFPQAALVGATAGLDTGSFTYKNTILKGVESEVFTDAELDAIHAAGAICFLAKAGDNVTSEGKVLSGEYVDIIDSKDYVVKNIEYSIQKVLNSAKKIPYDNNGIAMLESATINVLKDAYNKGMIAIKEDGMPDYSSTFATRDNTAASDRAERKYLNGSFSFGLAGAIHNVEIHGEIII